MTRTGLAALRAPFPGHRHGKARANARALRALGVSGSRPCESELSTGGNQKRPTHCVERFCALHW